MEIGDVGRACKPNTACQSFKNFSSSFSQELLSLIQVTTEKYIIIKKTGLNISLKSFHASRAQLNWLSLYSVNKEFLYCRNVRTRATPLSSCKDSQPIAASAFFFFWKFNSFVTLVIFCLSGQHYEPESIGGSLWSSWFTLHESISILYWQVTREEMLFLYLLEHLFPFSHFHRNVINSTSRKPT